MPHEIFTGLFVAEAVTYARARDPDSATAELALAQIQSCQLLFHEVREFLRSGYSGNGIIRRPVEEEDSRNHRTTGAAARIGRRNGFRMLDDWGIIFLGEYNAFPQMFPEMIDGGD
ncbi:hypothetical protein NA57DRAFT_50649 [Rhizodiscina lignyota]|uniref:Uncharacterized protein n=1 Tax=Rhizodiscina lignyota TaxID=1504668 RepID=A0A9P4MFR5_9PEZI|nr:hypothetical protein NA57DRAFT_50649 [Rhizodiscina lignyota]